MRSHTVAFLVLTLSLLVVLPSFVFGDTEHDFPVGMYLAASRIDVDNPNYYLTIREIFDGNTGGYEGCNLLMGNVTLVENPGGDWDSDDNLAYYEDLLDHVYNANTSDSRPKLVVIIDYYHFSNQDGIHYDISQDDLDDLEYYLDELLDHPHSNLIAGYYIADEPYNGGIYGRKYNLGGYPPADIETLYDAIKDIDTRTSIKIYIGEQVGSATNHYDYDTYKCDVMMIEYYGYIGNSASIDYGTLEGWNEPLIEARSELSASKELHAILKLQTPSAESTRYCTLGMSHAAIRHVLDYEIEGIWIYSWCLPTTEKAARSAWTSSYNHAEAFENELHDVDDLVTAYVESDGASRIYSATNASLVGPRDTLLGSTSSSKYVKSLAAADLLGKGGCDGQAWSDTRLTDDDDNTYLRSTADGDDELLTALSNTADTAFELYYSHDGSAALDSLRHQDNSAIIKAMARGDFDGDGDGDIAIAFDDGVYNSIYIVDSGHGNGVARTIDWREALRSDDCTITALAACDWDYDGKDALVWAYEKSGTDYIRYGDIDYPDLSEADFETEGDGLFSDATWEVTAMTAGDFQGCGADSLIVALYRDDTGMSMLCIGGDDGSEDFDFDTSNSIWSSGYYRVTAIDVGRFWDPTDTRGGRDWFVSAYTNRWQTESAIYLGDLGEGYIHGNNNINSHGTRLWYSTSGAYCTAITTGSFDESDPPSMKIAFPTSNADAEQNDNDTPITYDLAISTHPNPFNPSTTISFTLPTQGRAHLTVYSATGQKVATLVDDVLAAGAHHAVFDGTGLASGIYFYRLDAGEVTGTGKMLLVK